MLSLNAVSKDDSELIVITSLPTLDSNLQFINGEPAVEQITLNRDRCVHPMLINSFLTLLRHNSDDIIKQRLNDYAKPNTGFYSVEERCASFLESELYPNWATRNKVISFCEQEVIKMKSELDTKQAYTSQSKRAIVEARLDPYAARDLLDEQIYQFSDLNAVTKWVKNNKGIESILQRNTNVILKQNCNQNLNYIDKFWEFSQKRKRN